MDYRILRTELQNARYSTLTDAAAAADINDSRIERIRSSMSGDEVRQQTNGAEFAALTDHRQGMWISFCSAAVINPAAQANIDLVKFVFGAASATVENLDAARRETVSRASQLGLATVTEKHVANARAM